MKNTVQSIISEVDLFHLLVRKHKRSAVGRVFLAVQAALAYEQKYVNAGAMMGCMLAEGRELADSYCEPLGADGLAYFQFLFDVQLHEEGETDYHVYRFTRRYDGRSIEVYLKTDQNPTGEKFKAAYERAIKKVAQARDRLAAQFSWVDTATLFKKVFGKKAKVLEATGSSAPRLAPDNPPFNGYKQRPERKPAPSGK